jgi:thiol-disulfide isomerase/thioredoxin
MRLCAARVWCWWMRGQRALGLALLACLLAGCASGLAEALTRPTMPVIAPKGSGVPTEMASKREYYGNVRAPDFPPDLEWLNTGRRLSLADLRGKIVLLDFWTSGCINCMHIIPDLKRLEAAYPDELVVIGVHSAKFTNESSQDNLRQTVLRYDLEHPVVNDKDFVIWNNYVVRAWPTTILIDPRGYVLAAHSGEGVYDAWHVIIAEAVRKYDAQGLLDRKPLTLALEKAAAPDTALSFPGKVLADEAGGRLFIADSGHHRIVVVSLTGEVQMIIGSGMRGMVDGVFGQARFARPQGVALHGDKLYIADTENHALRLADLRKGIVRTLAGDGSLTYDVSRGPASGAHLNSPWDLVLVGSHLYIAMAGIHQLWDLDLADMTIGPYAGSGREGLLDGPLDRAALAQPSGITTDGRVPYFADSEASAVRVAEPGPSGAVRTIIGQGLFEFGDMDGDYLKARLQHPLGILWYQGVLYVADTYNHKIKTVDPGAARATTWLGSGDPGWRDGDAPQFYEPGGLAGAGDRLYIADTNNHVVRVADVRSRQVSTLLLRDPQGLLIQQGREAPLAVLHLPEQRVQPGTETIRLVLDLPQGYKVNDDAPSMLTWQPPSDGILRLADDQQEVKLAGRDYPLRLGVILSEGTTLLKGELVLYYCAQVNANTCYIRLARLEIPVVVTGAAPGHEIGVTIPIEAPQ